MPFGLKHALWAAFKRRDAAGFRVQEVAEHDEARRAACRKKPRQPREIRRRRAARNRHAAGAKRRTLAEVHVGDEQRVLSRPAERALGVQHDALAAHDCCERTIGHGRGSRASEGKRKGHESGNDLCDVWETSRQTSRRWRVARIAALRMRGAQSQAEL